MKEVGVIVTVASLVLLFIGLIIIRGVIYKPGKSKHVSGTFPIVIKHPFVWKIVFVITIMLLILSLIIGFLIAGWGLEGLSLLVVIVPVLVGTSWSFGWQLEIYEDKIIFRNMIWRKRVINYETINIVNHGSGIKVYKQKRLLFEATIWHTNYDELYDFISTKVKIKPFIRKKYMK